MFLEGHREAKQNSPWVLIKDLLSKLCVSYRKCIIKRMERNFVTQKKSGKGQGGKYLCKALYMKDY